VGTKKSQLIQRPGGKHKENKETQPKGEEDPRSGGEMAKVVKEKAEGKRKRLRQKKNNATENSLITESVGEAHREREFGTKRGKTFPWGGGIKKKGSLDE